jgi:hypothetical protein
MSKRSKEDKISLSIKETEIPKSDRIRERIPEYDNIVKAICEKPIGTEGEILIKGKSIGQVYSALFTHRKEIEDTTPFLLMLRDVKRVNGSKTGKMISGKLYFKRVTVEDYQRLRIKHKEKSEEEKEISRKKRELKKSKQ